MDPQGECLGEELEVEGGSCLGEEGNRETERQRERDEEGGRTSKASHSCFCKASLCLLGIPTVYLASLYSAASLPKGSIG